VTSAPSTGDRAACHAAAGDATSAPPAGYSPACHPAGEKVTSRLGPAAPRASQHEVRA